LEKLRIKCLVTGGAGFIGSHLTELLLSTGYRVTVVDNLSVGKKKNLEHLMNSPRLNFIELDVTNYEDLSKIITGHEWVFHLAALADIVPSIEDPKSYFDANVVGTFNIAKLCSENNVKRVIYSASSSCYGIPKSFPTNESAICDPRYPYALTKFLGEQIMMHWWQVYKLPILSLRLFNVYGPRARTSGTYGAVFGVFLAQKLAGMPFTVVGDGKQTRDFTFVSDICEAFLAAAKSNVSGEVINVGSGHTYEVNQLVKLLNGPIVNVPKRPGEPDCTFADISKIKAILDWSPKIDLQKGVSIMLDNIKDWKDAPLWDKVSIEKATKSWFRYLDNSIEMN
jgi:UDP-glucose 4-epimerase